MTDADIQELERKLWKTADDLRQGAGIKASQYAQPIFGLIFLRFADNKYRKIEADVVAEYNKRKGTLRERSLKEIAIRTCGFYLPDCARYDYILSQPAGEKLTKAVHDAMEAVEKENDDLRGVLPKNAYAEIGKSKDENLLKKLVQNFKDIPDDVEIDIFGKIYEYFLGEFSLKEGQGGGVFYTQVDTTHRKFTEEQQRSLALITRLYEGDKTEYAAFKSDLASAIAAAKADKADRLAAEESAFASATDKIWNGRAVCPTPPPAIAKKLAKAKEKHEKIVAEITKTSDAEIARLEGHLSWIEENFPNGAYRDVKGLCKAAKVKGEGGIEENGWSLNPGRYVGVVQIEDTTTPEQFRDQMQAMHAEFAALTAEAHKLERQIAANLAEVLG